MGDTAGVRIRAEPLDPEAWAAFGWLPVDDTNPAVGAHRLTFEWGDPHLNVISHAADEVERHGDALRCDALYRHVTHSQALHVLNTEAVVAVAAPGTVFDGPADAARISAFHLVPGQCLVLFPGTWHWGPFPLGEAPVRLLNLQGQRYLEDNTCVDLAAVGAAVDVVVAAPRP
ncbi:MAG: ureidoglycolate lyase [Gemmatimonadales bacterium]